MQIQVKREAVNLHQMEVKKKKKKNLGNCPKEDLLWHRRGLQTSQSSKDGKFWQDRSWISPHFIINS